MPLISPSPHPLIQIQQWLKSELGLSIAYKTVYEVVHNRLGAKLKVPRPQSAKQQE
ncbi:winged helix-turn-helix domain-containing protein [Nostoc sp. UHCC 0702]|nr:winged helix-turn-helix domain-containing protein [Nostoc sp. UHCC 0702]